MRLRSHAGSVRAAAAALGTTALLAPAAQAAGDRAAGDRATGDAVLAALPEDLPQRLRPLGLMFDLGTLNGAMLSLVYRPSPWLRVYGGAGTNGAAPGLRAGAAALPWGRGFGLSLDGGHFFAGDVNGIFATFSGGDYDDSHLLEHFDYDFIQLQAGWDVEQAGLLFFVRAGVGFVWTELPPQGLDRVRNLSSLVDPDGSVEAFLPSIQLGFIGFL